MNRIKKGNMEINRKLSEIKTHCLDRIPIVYDESRRMEAIERVKEEIDFLYTNSLNAEKIYLYYKICKEIRDMHAAIFPRGVLNGSLVAALINTSFVFLDPLPNMVSNESLFSKGFNIPAISALSNDIVLELNVSEGLEERMEQIIRFVYPNHYVMPLCCPRYSENSTDMFCGYAIYSDEETFLKAGCVLSEIEGRTMVRSSSIDCTACIKILTLHLPELDSFLIESANAGVRNLRDINENNIGLITPEDMVKSTIIDMDQEFVCALHEYAPVSLEEYARVFAISRNTKINPKKKSNNMDVVFREDYICFLTNCGVSEQSAYEVSNLIGKCKVYRSSGCLDKYLPAELSEKILKEIEYKYMFPKAHAIQYAVLYYGLVSFHKQVCEERSKGLFG